MAWPFRRSDGESRSRVQALLAEAPVVWLSTVRPDGRPHLIPIWFWWDGEAVLFASKPQAIKVANLRVNGDCMLAVGEPDDDFDVALIEAHAELVSMPTDRLLAAGLLDKYADRMAAGGLDRQAFAETYTQVVRLVPTRWLPWHGRSARPEWRDPLPTALSFPAPA